MHLLSQLRVPPNNPFTFTGLGFASFVGAVHRWTSWSTRMSDLGNTLGSVPGTFCHPLPCVAVNTEKMKRGIRYPQLLYSSTNFHLYSIYGRAPPSNGLSAFCASPQGVFWGRQKDSLAHLLVLSVVVSSHQCPLLRAALCELLRYAVPSIRYSEQTQGSQQPRRKTGPLSVAMHGRNLHPCAVRPPLDHGSKGSGNRTTPYRRKANGKTGWEANRSGPI